MDALYRVVKRLLEPGKIPCLAQKGHAERLRVALPSISRRERDCAKPSPLSMAKSKRLLHSLGDKGEVLQKTYFGREV